MTDPIELTPTLPQSTRCSPIPLGRKTCSQCPTASKSSVTVIGRPLMDRTDAARSGWVLARVSTWLSRTRYPQVVSHSERTPRSLRLDSSRTDSTDTTPSALTSPARSVAVRSFVVGRSGKKTLRRPHGSRRRRRRGCATTGLPTLPECHRGQGPITAPRQFTG